MLWRSTLREIRQSLGRFITIFVIIALGVGFFTGLRVAKPAMVETGNRYISEQNLYDFRLINSLGYTDDDVTAISSYDGVEFAEGSYFINAFFNTPLGENEVLCAHSITENINKVKLQEGRMPQNPNECVVDDRYFSHDDIGKTISVSSENDEDTKDAFKYDEYTVVGIVSSPYYLNFERGQADIGDGQVDAFVYIPYEGFDVDYYAEVFVSLTQKEYMYSDEYDDLIANYTDGVEAVAEDRADIRYNTIIEDGNKEIADAELELNDAKAEYNDAVNKLDDAWSELENARKELAEGWQEYYDGRNELAQKAEEAQAEIDDAKQQLQEALVDLNSGEEDYKTGLAEYNDGLAEYNDGKAELDDAKAELDSARRKLNSTKKELQQAESSYNSLSALNSAAVGIAAQTGFSDGSELIYAIENGLLDDKTKAMIDEALAGYGMTSDSLASAWRSAESQLSGELAQAGQSSLTTAFLSGYLPELKNTIDNGWSQYSSGLREYNEGLREYNEGLAELEEAKAELDDAKKQLDEARAELDSGWDEYYSGQEDVLEAETTLAEETEKALSELEDAENQLTEGEKEYKEGLQEYLSSKAEADVELADAAVQISDGENELANAREDLASIESPTVYVMDRSMNTGYACFESDTDIIEGIASVFPLFFLLVAALVCITTMTRMVDEHRGQIGTLKALGYGRLAIMNKFLFYSGSASFAGCIVGFLFGSYLFPKVLWKAYNIMYGFSDIVFMLDYFDGVVSTVAYLSCAMLATYFVCRSELAEAPSQIMRPRSPKNGKRILLERISPIWKRLSFLYKVSLRNIFRYKKRLLMMIVGIAGSTALLLTGFGINDSIKNVVNYQYDEISVYDLTVTFSEGLTQSDREEFESKYTNELEGVKYLMNTSTDVIFSGVSKQAYMLVPEGDSLEGFFDMHDEDGEKVEFPGLNEVVINNGLAEAIGVSVGDTVIVKDQDMNEMELTVSGIIENYVYNYVFISEETYEAQMGYAPDMETAYICTSEGTDVHSTAAKIMSDDNVANVSTSSEMRDRVNSMMDSLNYVVILVICCAGALSFTVIYNLTNINITERIREIATIKVLGFYPIETASYVFRENMIMTGMGSLIGLVLGKLLHLYVMNEIKVDLMSFDIRISGLSYGLSILVSFIFAGIVMFFMYFKLRRINMAESLKSVE